MFRIILFILSLTVFTSSGLELARRYQDTHYLMLDDAPLNQADNLLDQQHWLEAKYLASIVKVQTNLGSTERAQSIEIAADAALESLPTQSRAFLKGMLSGEPDNGASLLGALTLDLFIIGDVRDLIVQGYKQVTTQEGDKIILALSATGLGLSLLPQLHWAPSILKGFKRSNALSKPFVKSLARLSETALKTGNFKPLAKVVADFGRTAKKMGLGPTKGAMRAIKNEADMAKLAGATVIKPRQAYAISSLTGTRGIKMLSQSGDNVVQIALKLKRTSRLAKIAKKSFNALPYNLVLGTLGISALLMLTLLWSRRKKKDIRGHPLASRCQ